MPGGLTKPRPSAAQLLCGCAGVLVGAAGAGLFLQSVLSSQQAAGTWLSRQLWQRVVELLAGSSSIVGGIADVPFLPLFVIALAGIGLVWLTGTAVLSLVQREPVTAALTRSGLVAGGVWGALGLLDLTRAVVPLSASQWLTATSHLWFSFCLSAQLAAPLVWSSASSSRAADSAVRPRVGLSWGLVVVSAGLWTALFTWMNWSLYDNLLLPHGDSAMYEEHIWNLTHGKGFRSYLDQGLFLGEHIQVVHLLLTPLHLVWPSQLLLELCESLALASCSIAVFLIARRHRATELQAAVLGITWLLYFPLHYLDIAIDFKTFRPMCFGVPAVLFAIDQWERRRFRTSLVLLAVALSAKEDFALVIAPLLLYFALTADARTERVIGFSACAATAVYLVLAVLVVIPAFRAGETVHYSRYFGELGSSPTEIVSTAFRDPLLVLSRLFGARSFLYAVLLLLPCGFLPLISWTRVLVAVPVFAMLCLLELSPEDTGRAGEAVQQQMLVPFHHFHATILPVLWWAAATGLGQLDRTRRAAVAFALCCAVTTGAFYSMSPLGIGFYDSGSRLYGKELYGRSERAQQIEKVLAAIPVSARVASTDFVHTRFTHYERSYDYSEYRREVPEDADYIVIDARHPWPGYSMASDVSEVRELRLDPDGWEPLEVDTNGYFIVLKRRRQE